jgi:hypothetical protein
VFSRRKIRRNQSLGNPWWPDNSMYTNACSKIGITLVRARAQPGRDGQKWRQRPEGSRGGADNEHGK